MMTQGWKKSAAAKIGDIASALRGAAMSVGLALGLLGFFGCGDDGDGDCPRADRLGCSCQGDSDCGNGAQCLSGRCVGGEPSPEAGMPDGSSGSGGGGGRSGSGGSGGAAPDRSDASTPDASNTPDATSDAGPGDDSGGPDSGDSGGSDAAMADPRCVENAGNFCEGAVLHLCDADNLYVSSETCDSERLCQQGTAAGRCPICEPETYRCEDTQLQVCASDGLSYEDDTLCATAALCNALVGACTDATCLPTTKICDGDNLMRCNAAQDGFELEQGCGSGLCDMAGGQCDVCFAGAHSCNAGQRRVCNSNGQGYSAAPCTGAADICTGNGACVECLANGDCTQPANQCEQARCEGGACVIRDRAIDTACTMNGGTVCDGDGDCVECNVTGDCPDGICSGQTCVECVANGDCTQPTNQCRQARCQDGACVTSNRAIDTACTMSGGTVCDGEGNCVDCNVTADCSDGFCSGETCVECLSVANCSAGTCETASCNGGTCSTTPTDGNGCGSNMVCNQGECETACGNGRIDTGIVPPEQCDPNAAGYSWYTCDPVTCRPRTYYTVCSADSNCDNDCLNDANAQLYVCAPACTGSGPSNCPEYPGATAADEGPPGTFLQCINGDCVIYCRAECFGDGSCDWEGAGCPPHLRCQPVFMDTGYCVRR